MNKGVSLIVLVITILVIIILASSVILSLSDSNPILSAGEATFKSDVTTMQTELDMYIIKMYAQELGNFDPNTMNGQVSDFIPSVTKYNDTFEVVNGKLIYKGEDSQTLSYVRNMNIDLITDYDGTVQIVESTTNVIDKNQGTVEAWVNVTNLMREEVTDKYILSTYADEKYTNTLSLRHTRDNKWQAIMSSDYNNVSDISVSDTLNEGWHLFSLKWNSSEFSLFIDGVKVATTNTPKLMQTVATNLYIGSGPKLNLSRNGYVAALDNSNFTSLTRITDDYVSSIASFKGINQVYVESSDYIHIDPNKVFYQSGQFKSLKIGTISRSYYGIRTYDKDKQYIDDRMTNHYVNTETELAQNLNVGDTIVYLKSAANWKKSTDSSSSYRFLGIYPYKDYPVYTYTRNFYQFSDSNIINNTITLSSPYSGAFMPVGTKVANKYSGPGSYTYNTICNEVISNNWKEYSSTITGNYINSASHNIFRYGTEYIKVMILLNWYNYSNDTILIDDIEFKDMTDTIFNSKIQEVCISNIARTDSDILNRYKTGVLSKDSNVTYMLTEQ